MTLRTPGGPLPAGQVEHQVGHVGLHDTVARLRAAADQLVAFSQTKTLLREAASTLERLDGDTRRLESTVARLTAELAHAPAAPRS